MKKEKVGLIILVASLLAVATISWSSFEYHYASRLSQIRSQGASLAKLLSIVGLRQLVSSDASRSAVHLIQSVHPRLGFAYVAVTDPEGRVLIETTEPNVGVPVAPLANEPASWYGERTLKQQANTQQFREFHAPVLAGGQLAGYVRVGYQEPGWRLALQEMRFYAWLALPIALLALVSYYVMKTQLRPLRLAAERLHAMIEDKRLQPVELSDSGEVGEFVQNFNQAIGATNEQVRMLRAEQNEMMLSSKVLSYQKTLIESVLHSVPHAIIATDESSSVMFANKRVGALVGVDGERMVGHKPNEWCRSSELLAFLAKCHMTTASQELEIPAGKAADRHLEASAYPLFSTQDSMKIQGRVILIRDVTKEVLARNARKEFVGHLAHELKTPLQVIGMHSETLLEDAGASKDIVIEAGNTIHDEVERVSSLIRNMLNITEIEMGSLRVDRRRTNLSELLRDAFDNVARSAGHDDLSFKLDVPHGLSVVNLDKDLMRVAINNLLTNALKYNRPGGQVTLGAEEIDDAIIISVSDTGIGISDEDRARLFDKFYRSSRPEVQAKPGNGLGLALMHDIVTLHQAEVRIESQLGVGSRFSIVLPKNSQLLLKEAV